MQQDKLYLNPELNLAQLADHVSLPQKTISEILNQHLHKNFNEFVNEYRINEILARIFLPESKKFTITSLAFDCGFNSQPTFQRAFKSIKGLSPSEFIAKNESKTVSDHS
jgi:AraC-like DNA-binding protein